MTTDKDQPATQAKRKGTYYQPVTTIEDRSKIKQWCTDQRKTEESLIIYLLLSDLQRAEARLVEMMGSHAPPFLKDLVNAATPKPPTTTKGTRP